METHPKPTSLFLNYFKKETLSLNTAVAAATITFMWSRIVAPTTAVASLPNDSLCSLSTQLRRRRRHCRVSFLFLSICLFFYGFFNELCLFAGKAKESKICFAGFMGCVDPVLFQKLWDLWVFHVVWFRDLLGFDSWVVLCSL